MKILHFIPPVAALIFSGVWIGMQRQSAASLRHETVVLRERITAAMTDSAARAAEPASIPRGGKPSANEVENMSWEEIAAALEPAGSATMPDIRLMVALQRRLMAMSTDELLAALDAIEALELSGNEKLVDAILELLAKKAPEALLDRYAEKLNAPVAGPIRGRLATAFQSFVAKDAAAAEAWLDRQLAAGHFVSRSLSGTQSMRSMFEGRLISSLVGSDPAGAAHRLREMPDAQRGAAMLFGVPHPLRDGQVAALLRLTKEFVPPDHASQRLDHLATQLVAGGGLERVERTLAHLDDPQSSARLAAASARHQFRSSNNAETLDAMREWLRTQAPGEVDRFTGEALGGFDGRSLRFEPSTGETLDDSGGRTFGQAAALALQYHEESGSDEVLAAFLRGQMARRNQPEARELLEHIGDDALRDDLRRDLERPGR